MKFPGILFILIFLAGGFVSCTQDDDLSINDLSQIVAQGGDWQVTYFFDKDKEETHKFENYTFRFEDDGTMKAFLSGALMSTGTWSVRASSNKFVIEVEGTDALNELTDDWLIIEKTDRKIILRDDNDEHLEEIHLERV